MYWRISSIYRMKILFYFLISMAAVSSCEGEKQQETVPTQKEVNKGMEAVNRQMMLEEDAVIQGYIERRGWNMTKSGTGIWYEVLESGPEGPLAKEGQVAKVAYKVSLIDGEVVYSSDENGERAFLIGQDDVESGIHEAVTYLKKGDRARVVLPSYRAHGLTGDNDKIPPRSTVIYEITLVDLR